MKSLIRRCQGFTTMGIFLTSAVILLGGGALLWEWRSAHPSGKGHAAKATTTSTAEHHHHHKDKEGKKHHNTADSQ